MKFEHELLTTKDAADILDVSVVTVRRMVHAGFVHVYAKGLGERSWLFDSVELHSIRAERLCFRSYQRNKQVKRPVITKNVGDAVMSPAVRAFQRLNGKGMTELWDIVLSYADPKTGKIEGYYATLANEADVSIQYVKDCFEYWSRWQWIKSGYNFGTSKIVAELMHVDGSVPEGGIPEYTDEEMAEDGDGWKYTADESDNDALDCVDGVDADVIPEPDYLPSDSEASDLFDKPLQKPSKPVKITKYRPSDDEIQCVFEYWKSVMGRNNGTHLDANRTKLIKWALDTYQSVERCKLAINGLAASAWHMGQNPSETKYNELKHVFKDSSAFESFEMRGAKAKTYIDTDTGKVKVKISNGERTQEERVAALVEALEEHERSKNGHQTHESRLFADDGYDVYSLSDTGSGEYEVDDSME
jgi:hypothetical protein